MLGRRLKMFLRDREVAVLGAAAILTVLMWTASLGRLGATWRMYLSPSYRRDATAVLASLRADTGWGLSNFQIVRTSCSASSCDLKLDFAYHGVPAIKPPSSTFELSWTPGKPETYVVHVL